MLLTVKTLLIFESARPSVIELTSKLLTTKPRLVLIGLPIKPLLLHILLPPEGLLIFVLRHATKAVLGSKVLLIVECELEGARIS